MTPERALYVCRLYRPEHGGTARKCVDCGATVSVSPGVYADRVRFARSLGTVLEIVCDGCANCSGLCLIDGQPSAVFGMESDRGVVVVMPSCEEILATNTARDS